MQIKDRPIPLVQDELLKNLEETVEAFTITKDRYKPLLLIEQELGLLADHMLAQPGTETVPVRNFVVFQMKWDSFHMLVIDLASIRNGMTNRSGLLGRLKKTPERLRKCESTEFGEQHSGALRTHVAELVDAALARLFPNEYPITEHGMTTLIREFRRETEPVHIDRNKYRAHRYEGNPVSSKEVHHLTELGGQIKIFERYLSDLYLILTRSTHGMKMNHPSPLTTTASDLADIILHGSINQADRAYKVAKRSSVDTTLLYGVRRKGTLRAER